MSFDDISFMNLLAIVVLLSLLSNCKVQNEELRELKIDDSIDYFHRNKFEMSKDVVFKISNKKIVDFESLKLEIKDYGFDYYINEKGLIKTINLRGKSYKDNILSIIISNYQTFPFSMEVYPFKYDCDCLDPILEIIFDFDQQINNNRIDWLINNDSLNYVRTFSILSMCPVESLSRYDKRELAGLFLAIQHSFDGEMISFFYPYFKYLVEKQIFSKGALALMTDRLLLRYNYPQVFGTQIGKDFRMPENLMSPDSLNEYRDSMGLEPIEDYITSLEEMNKDR